MGLDAFQSRWSAHQHERRGWKPFTVNPLPHDDNDDPGARHALSVRAILASESEEQVFRVRVHRRTMTSASSQLHPSSTQLEKPHRDGLFAERHQTQVPLFSVDGQGRCGKVWEGVGDPQNLGGR